MTEDRNIMVKKELVSLFWAMDNYFVERDAGRDFNLDVYLTAAELAVDNLRKDREQVVKEENGRKIIPFKNLRG